MKIERLILLTIKKYMMKPIYLIFLLFSVIICITSGSVKLGDNSGKIRAAFCFDNDSQIEQDIVNSLINYDGYITFYEVNNTDELRKAVLLGNADTGYEFCENFTNTVVYSSKKETINVYTCENSVFTPIINETLFSLIFPEISNITLEDYIFSQEILESNDENTALIEAKYTEYYYGDKVFGFNYENTPGKAGINETAVTIAPLQGFISLLILISGFAGLLSLNTNSNPLYELKRYQLVNIYVPQLILSIILLICIFLTGSCKDILPQILSLLIYPVICTIYIFCLKLIIKKGTTIATIIPFLILSCIAFTPVLTDLSPVIPILGKIRYLFPTTYYLLFHV